MDSLARWKIFCLLGMLCAAVVSSFEFSASAPAPTSPYSGLQQFSKLDRLYRAFVESHERAGGDHRVVLSLAPSRAYSDQFSRGGGVAYLDLIDGAIELQVTGFDSETPLSAWLVDNQPGAGRSAQPEEGDRMIDLGRLSFNGSRWESTLQLDRDAFVKFEVDQVVITDEGLRPSTGGLLFGSPTLFQRTYTRHRLQHASIELHPQSRFFSEAFAQIEFPSFDELVLEGANLFLNETFDGNGRTCGTCHPPHNNFTIDPVFIASLPDDHPLFVAEFDPELAVDFEDPAMMREHGLILVNADGFETHTLRSVSHTLGLSRTLDPPPGFPHAQATGWDGDGALGGTLREFANGAIRQHNTRTLGRVAGVDFRFATDQELDALEAFQLFLGREDEPDTETMLFTDPLVSEGRDLFNRVDSSTGRSGKCIVCHANGGANREAPFAPTSVNINADTRVQDLSPPEVPPDGGFGITVSTDPGVSGFGDGTFNVPSLIEAADTPPFFHNNVAMTIEEAVLFYLSPTFASSPAANNIAVFDEGVGVTLIPEDSVAIGAFLRVLNALENIRSARESLLFAGENAAFAGQSGLLQLADFDLEDAVEVLLPQLSQPLHLSARGLLETARSNVGSMINTTDVSESLLVDTLCLLDAAKHQIVSNSVEDCDGSGVSDHCEILQGVLADCDGNGIPDSCEIADGLANDCNQNSIPDHCDLLQGIEVDSNAPVFLELPGDQVVMVEGSSCSAIVDWVPPTVIDDCGVLTVEVSHIPGSLFELGTSTVTYTAIDLHGNNAVASFEISVVDLVPPTLINMPESVMLGTDPESCSAQFTWSEPTATDNCHVMAFTSTALSGTDFPLGSTVVEYSVVDASGNSSQSAFTVTVVDDDPPSLTPSGTITVFGESHLLRRNDYRPFAHGERFLWFSYGEPASQWNR